MFAFSDAHNWQDNDQVKQILVFPNSEVHNSFNVKFKKRVTINGIEDASDSGIGAIYKFRAIRNSSDKWVPLIRCGVTGEYIWEAPSRVDSYQHALMVCESKMKEMINESFGKFYGIVCRSAI